MQPSEFIRAAHCENPCDLLLANARIVDVFSGEIAPGSVAVADGWKPQTRTSSAR